MNINKERAAFEADLRVRLKEMGYAESRIAMRLERRKDGEYSAVSVVGGFGGWLACAEAKQAEIDRLTAALDAAIGMACINLSGDYIFCSDQVITTSRHPAIANYLREKQG